MYYVVCTSKKIRIGKQDLALAKEDFDACRAVSSLLQSLHQSFLLPRKLEIKSIGRGKMMVEFFSAEMELSVCK